MTVVGFVGAGEMGGRMATRLLRAGWSLAIYDTRCEVLEPLRELGAHTCASPAEVAGTCETVMLSLPTPEVVGEVVAGVDGLMRTGNDGRPAIRTCIDLSTTGPATARHVATELAGRGIELIDAPVSGGIGGAERGTLTVMAACAPDLLERARPLLDELAAHVFHVGDEPGLGQLAKVINNLLSATALVASAEALTLGVKAGLDAELMLSVLNASSGRNSATEDKLPRAVLPRTFDFGFGLSLMNKDVQICLAEASALGARMPVGEAVGAEWARAVEALAPGSDCTEIVKLVEERIGATIAPRRDG
jgi:3-hydroxyisobutyrate dehydrogenase-like beta-hydroxyacid dehydrogenase